MKNSEHQKYFNRFEYKYIIPIILRDQIIRDISPFCKVDAHSSVGSGYEVNSLYYDSDQLGAYFEKINGEKERTKVRLRYYGYSKESNPTFALEIKKKYDQNVIKHRSFISPAISRMILDNEEYASSSIIAQVPLRDQPTVAEVLTLVRANKLKPKVLVKYHRQAFESLFDRYLRITFDTELRGLHPELPHCRPTRFLIPMDHTVMEIKFNSIVPKWLTLVIQKNSCRVLKISKYCSGIEALYHYCLR